MEQVVSRQPNAVYLSGLKSGTGALTTDAALAALPIGACLFNTEIGPATVLIVFGSVLLTFWLRIERIPGALARIWPIVLFPIFVLASFLWSEAPSATARYGILYAITVASGLLIATCLDRRAVLIGILFAYAAFLVTGFLIGGTHAVGYKTGITAFVGIAGSKNMAGSSAAIAILLSLASFSLARQIRSLGVFLLALITLPMAAVSLYLAISAGAVIGGGAAIICLMMWLVSQRMPRQARASILLIISLVVIVAVATVEFWLPTLFELLLTGSGKDSGLTGRVGLWRTAGALIDQRPFLGQGFGAFWLEGNYDAEAIWRDFGIKSREGFNFHNTALELLVSLGWLGFGLFVTIALSATLTLFWRTMVRPDPARIFFCAWMVYWTLRTYFESMGLGQMYAETILAFAAFGLGFARDEQLEAARRTQASTAR